MSCTRYNSELLALAAGEVGTPSANLQSHLNACAACRAQFAAYREVLKQADSVLSAQLTAAPSPAFAARVRSAIAEGAAPSQRWFMLWRPAAALVLAGLAIFAVWSWNRTTPGRTSPPETAKHAPSPPVQPQRDAAIASITARPEFAPAKSTPRRRVKSPELLRTSTSGLEVIVRPGQMKSIVGLYQAVWRRKVDGNSLLAEGPALGELLGPAAPAELKIDALQVQVESLKEIPKSTGSDSHQQDDF